MLEKEQEEQKELENYRKVKEELKERYDYLRHIDYPERRECLIMELLKDILEKMEGKE